MKDTNLTLMLHGKMDIRLEERPVLEPGPGQVQVAMKKVGICGSDVAIWVKGEHGRFVLDGPLALGHEGSGVVSKVGSGVTTLKVGDRVAIEPATPCRLCIYCKGGRYNLCPDVKGLAMPGYDGHLTRLFVHDADFCHKIPDSMSFEEGAIAEPMAVCVHATNRAGIKMGDTVLICGAGPIGILCMLVCRARGVDSVTLTDIDQSRLDTAKRLGASYVINAMGKTPAQIAQEVDSTVGMPIDVTLECSGAAASVNTGIAATRPGGILLLIGVGPTTKEINIVEASMKEVDVKGIFRYVNAFQPAIRLMASGQVDAKPLISHRFELEQAVEAFEMARRGEGIKIMISCEQKDNDNNVPSCF